MASLISDWLRHIWLLLCIRWTELDETWLETRWSRVVWKTKMTGLASDCLRHFRHLLWKGWMEFNDTLQEARSQRPLPSLCFLVNRQTNNQKASDGPRHFLFLLRKRLMEFNRTSQEARSTKFVFFGRSANQDGHPDLLRHSRLLLFKPLNGIQRSLTGGNFSTFSAKFVFKSDRYQHVFYSKMMTYSRARFWSFGPLVYISAWIWRYFIIIFYFSAWTCFYKNALLTRKKS